MILVGQLHGRAHHFALALVVTEMVGDPPDPGPELPQSVARVRVFQLSPEAVHLHSRMAQAFDDQLILRIEMAVERHLVAVGGIGDRIDAGSADAVPAKEVSRSLDDAIARRTTGWLAEIRCHRIGPAWSA